jgi:receptor protein-tyrosine kinase
VVLVASPRPGEGRTTTATNLALALASAGQRVLLVAGGGDDPPPDRLAGPAAGGNLSLAAAGEASWSRLSESLGQARQAHDTVVLDSPPLLGGGEAALLAAQADGVVLVVRPGATRRDEAEQALEILRATDVPVVGVLFNAVSRPPLPAVVSYAWGVMQRGWEAVCRRFPVGGGLRWSWWRGLS